MKLLITIVIPVILILSACEQKNDLVFEKLVGTWKRDGVDEFERWTKNRDGSFTSRMFSVNKSDTVFSEVVRIYQSENNQFVFEVSVNGQNDGKPVCFYSTLLNPTQVTFENKEHDFPNTIHYSLNTTLKLSAFIAGKKDTVRFNFTRIEQ